MSTGTESTESTHPARPSPSFRDFASFHAGELPRWIAERETRLPAGYAATLRPIGIRIAG